jgi:hypothetical protein
VSWPPIIGEPLPRAEHAFGIEEKLAAYCLNPDHEVGGPKARAFRQALGIGRQDVDYLAEMFRTGIASAVITVVRNNDPFGVLCEVRIPVTGVREHRDRVVDVTTSWELRHAGDAPRLVTAYVGG